MKTSSCNVQIKTYILIWLRERHDKKLAGEKEDTEMQGIVAEFNYTEIFNSHLVKKVMKRPSKVR